MVDDKIKAAIALALKLHLDTDIHDRESLVITIKRRQSDWFAKGQTFRKVPGK